MKGAAYDRVVNTSSRVYSIVNSFNNWNHKLSIYVILSS